MWHLCSHQIGDQSGEWRDDRLRPLLRRHGHKGGPTGSGKSLIIYIIMRWFLENSDKKCLIIVPTTSLVEQMYKDFIDYATNDKWFDEESMHKIYSGKEKINIDQRVVAHHGKPGVLQNASHGLGLLGVILEEIEVTRFTPDRHCHLLKESQ